MNLALALAFFVILVYFTLNIIEKLHCCTICCIVLLSRTKYQIVVFFIFEIADDYKFFMQLS